MALSSGTRIGPYAIVAPIGAGGMGEVYRARDTRLDRDVQLQIRGVGYSFGLHPDGRRFVTGIRDNSIETPRHDSLVLVMGFADDLKARVK